jgi:hypothetical protein
MTLSALGIFSAAGAGGVQGDYELIETNILGSAQSSITFSSLATYASTYKHLQIRIAARATVANPTAGIISRLNADSGSNYNGHFLLGNGSSVSSGTTGTTTSALTGVISAASATANAFGAVIIDLLDPYSTTKNKTFRTLGGSASARIDLHSALWINTSSITSWQLLPDGGNFATGSRFSLYGIRG